MRGINTSSKDSPALEDGEDRHLRRQESLLGETLTLMVGVFNDDYSFDSLTIEREIS
jgi:hypothetical protein